MEDDDLINSFIEEAREHLPVIEASLLALEHKPDDASLLNELFRSVHTIKGGAGFFGLHNISTLTHCMESLLSLARSNKLRLARHHVDVLLESQDRLVQMIDDPQNSDTINVEDECRQLNYLIDNPHFVGTPAPETASAESEKAKPSDSVPVFNPVEEKVERTDVPKISVETPAIDVVESVESVANQIAQNDLLDSFIEEARECVPCIETALLALETNPTNTQQLNELFRCVDTIKRGSNFLGLNKVAKLTHIMSDILVLAKTSKLLLEGRYIDVLLEGYDCLVQLIAHYQADAGIEIQSVCEKLLELKQLGSLEHHAVEAETAVIPQAVGTPKPAINRVAAVQPAAETPAPVAAVVDNTPAPVSTPATKIIIEDDQTAFSHFETEETIRVHVKRLNKLIDLAGELVLVRNQVFRLCEPLIPQTPGLKVILHNFNRITTEMQEEIMGTRMQPIGVIFNKFPRLIRQLEKDLGKELELVTEGADVELDKTIIESLTAPVTHIIRNMADHGIESPQERIKKGKPACGTIVQKAFHESGQVVIQFSDDGRGMDPDFIANSAVEKGIITAEAMEKMTPKEKILLIFTPGFSTAKTLSSVSGRGIGMDVVKTNIEQIGGSIDINSQLGSWSSITMTLPLTMAIISALIVSAENCRFAFPQSNLEEMVLLEAEDYAKKVGTIHEQRMLSLRGDFLPLISLSQSLKMTDSCRSAQMLSADKPLYILIIKSENNRVAVIVDQILGSEEIVVKPMPEYFRQIKNFSGTSILGDGAIAMIIDVQGYIQKNHLTYTELQKDTTTVVQRQVEQEPQSLLIFDNNTEEHFALALSWIRRIDTLDVSRIQSIAGNEYIEYRGEQMRLLRLENCLPVKKPISYQSIANIIIPKRTKVPVALLINRVIDAKNIVIKLENVGIKAEGILGSMILDDGKITLMLDLHSILEMSEPESVEKISFNPDTTRTKRILLVEDTPFFMKVINECVSGAGYQVAMATNGREGLEALETGEFDLVLSDIEMPMMDGREMVKNIRANSRWDNLPVIALTTLNDAQTVAEGKKAGFNEWLVKLDKEVVLQTLARYL